MCRFVFIGIFCAVVSLVWGGELPKVDEGVGTLYLRQAEGYLAQGDYAAATASLSLAAEYVPSSREYLYLSTLLTYLQSGVVEVDAIQASFDSPRYPEWDLFRLPLLSRIGRHREAVELFQTYQNERIEWQPSIVRAVAASCFEIGERALGISLLEEGLNRSPHSSELAELLVWESEDARVEYMERLLSGELATTAWEEKVLLMLIRSVDKWKFSRLWELYLDRGLFSLDAEISRGRVMGWGDGVPLEALFEGGLLSDGDLTAELDRLLLFEEERERFDLALSEYSGEMEYDTNGDGWIEGRALYDSGELLEVGQDLDQNGEFDVVLKIVGGVPDTLTVEGRFQVSYHSYPWVESLERFSRDGHFRYNMGVEGYRLPVSGYPVALSYRILSVEPIWEAIADSALTTTLLEEGRVVWTYQRSWGENGITTIFDEVGQSVTVRRFSTGDTPTRAELFLMGRTEPDTVHRYEDGSVTELLHDGDGDGYYEYRETTEYPNLVE